MANPNGTAVAGDLDPSEVGVDWMEKFKQGGATMVALAMLSIIGVVFVLERFAAVRTRHVAPSTLSE